MVAVPMDVQRNPRANEFSFRILPFSAHSIHSPCSTEERSKGKCMFLEERVTVEFYIVTVLYEEIKPQMNIAEQIRKFATAKPSTWQCYSLLFKIHQFIYGFSFSFFYRFFFSGSAFTYHLFFHFNLVLLGFKPPLKKFCSPERRKWCTYTMFYFTNSATFSQIILYTFYHIWQTELSLYYMNI